MHHSISIVETHFDHRGTALSGNGTGSHGRRTKDRFVDDSSRSRFLLRGWWIGRFARSTSLPPLRFRETPKEQIPRCAAWRRPLRPKRSVIVYTKVPRTTVIPFF